MIDILPSFNHSKSSINNGHDLWFLSNLEYFIYDLDGVTGFVYKNGQIEEKYSYIKDALGDICYIVDESGLPVIQYIYDEWGNVNQTVLVSNNVSKYVLIGNVNPFRYRGYVYDFETKLYYLKSRYYDPFTHSFTSLDKYSYIDETSISGVNLYCYCNNNPIMYMDEDGNLWFLIPILAAIVLTINDIEKIKSGEVKVQATEDGVKIENSYKIKTPWVRLGYLFWVKYRNDETKGKIHGSIVGAEFEWFAHNIYYDFTGAQAAASVDIGKTIFNDDHVVQGSIMKAGYIVTQVIFFTWFIDLLIYSSGRNNG